MGHILSLFPKLALSHTLSTTGVCYFIGIFHTGRASNAPLVFWSVIDRISIGFDVRIGYVSMRHLTEPASYTGQFVSPQWRRHVFSLVGASLG